MFGILNSALAASLAIISFSSGVEGHGYVQEVVVGSTTYTGYLPYSDPFDSPPPERIIRKIPNNGPVTDMAIIDVQCNGWSEGGVIGSAPAPIFGTVAAGEAVALNWTTWPDNHKGPIITYMAKAPSDITAWSPGTDAVWFKVDEAGKTSDGKWAAPEVLAENKSIYTFTVPAALAPGQYIVRHEIIALHEAYAYPGAQFYPSCIQLEVTGSGTQTPTNLVAFPGAYTVDTPGIIFNITQDVPYPIPGPAVWTGN